MLDSTKPSVATVVMFFVIALAGIWILRNSKRFASMTIESWKTVGALQGQAPKPLFIVVQFFVILFGLTFIGIGLIMGVKGLLGR